MNLKTKLFISILTFAVGISGVAVWLLKFKSDINIYPVEFNVLIQNSKNYDGKIVKILTSYTQGYESSYLTDSNSLESITVTCVLERENCKKMFELLHQSLEQKEKIIVIGRYHDSEHQGFDGYVHTIEILEVKPTNAK